MNLENLKDVNKLKAAFNQFSKFLIVVLALLVGFVIGQYYYKSKEVTVQKLPMDLKTIHRLDGTSVAINERNELLVIDRKIGSYEIYSDSVGKVIFKLYASQMSSN